MLKLAFLNVYMRPTASYEARGLITTYNCKVCMCEPALFAAFFLLSIILALDF